jgi:glyoxylase-like metal-dependent hydrolase (beta-lactamase superfamily II)
MGARRSPGSRLFDLHKAAEGVFLAQARPQSRAMINCNAVVFVRSKDVVVVDAHGRPSAASALIHQLKREVTDKPVRYVINTHFHGDHTQETELIAYPADPWILSPAQPPKSSSPISE